VSTLGTPAALAALNPAPSVGTPAAMPTSGGPSSFQGSGIDPAPPPSSSGPGFTASGLGGSSTGGPGAGAGIGAPAAGPGTSSPAAGIRQALQGLGVQGDWQDDGQALRALAGAYQSAGQRNYYTDLGQSLAPHANDIREFLASRQPAQPEAKPGPWTPPPFDKRWLSVVEVDQATGQFRSKQGYDPAYGTQVQAYSDYVSGFQERFWTNPVDTIREMIGDYVSEQANQVVQQNFGAYREQVMAGQVVEQNRDWLYAKNQAGQAVIDPRTGRPALSPAGQRFYGYVEHAATRLGVKDIREQANYAMDMLERDVIRLQRQTAAAAAPAQPAAAAPRSTRRCTRPTSTSSGGSSSRPARTSNRPRRRVPRA
jgi:hypothetical protein